MILRRLSVSLLALTLAAPAFAGGAGGPAVTPLNTTCRADYVRPDFTALSRQLQAARARWAATGVRSYRYDVRQVAAPVLFPETRVTVTNGRVTSAVLKPGEAGEPNRLARQTVEQRFAAIAQTLAYQRPNRCPEVRVSYDPARGYPTALYSGMGDGGIADGYGEWTVTNFTVNR